MLFKNKVERAQKWLHERNQPLGSHKRESREDDLPSIEELKRESQELHLDKSDLPAMIFAALITILPICLLVLLAICAFVFLL